MSDPKTDDCVSEEAGIAIPQGLESVPISDILPVRRTRFLNAMRRRRRLSQQISAVRPEAVEPADEPPPPKPTTLEPVLALRNVSRAYPQGRGVLDVFKNLSLRLFPGEIVALTGPSGAGKSSLLHIAGLLEAPTDGEVLIAGRDCSRLNDVERTEVRRDRLGFVYQFHNLLPEFSALENVTLPQLIAGRPVHQAEKEARRLLGQLGLGQRLDHRPGQLSGGEQQRVAIARALANGPALLLADEPTGNLDPRTSARVFEVLLEIVRAEGRAALIATHNPALAARMDRTLKLEDGRLVEKPSPL